MICAAVLSEESTHTVTSLYYEAYKGALPRQRPQPATSSQVWWAVIFWWATTARRIYISLAVSPAGYSTRYVAC